MVDLIERIDTLLQQEVAGYRTVDYLSPEFQNKLLDRFSATSDPVRVPAKSSLSTVSSTSSSSSSGISEQWREKICEWSYQGKKEWWVRDMSVASIWRCSTEESAETSKDFFLPLVCWRSDWSLWFFSWSRECLDSLSRSLSGNFTRQQEDVSAGGDDDPVSCHKG